MKLRFDDITAIPDHYTIDGGDWVPQEEDHTVSAVAQITVNKRDSLNVVLRGELTGTHTTSCGRCGTEVKNDLSCSFEYLITKEVDQASKEQDVECVAEDESTLYLEKPEIEVYEILREQAYLEIPQRTLCSETCKGICVQCGTDLNSTNCTCSKVNTNSPFAVLSKMKK